MEIEMKYRIPHKDMIEAIWNDADILKMEETNSREKVFMKASYFDTDDYTLSKNNFAFRIRMEGNRIVASLKLKGESSEGLHTREEINVPVDDEGCFIRPNPAIFRESDAGRQLIEMVGQQPLHSLLETRFLRSKLRIDTGTTLCELAIDVGEIITDFGNLPICEMELELFSGDQEELKKLGDSIAEKYQLIPEDTSKYARGLKILEDHKYLDV